MDISGPDLAKIFGVTDRQVRNLADQGVVIRLDHGRYALAESLRGYIAFKVKTELARLATTPSEDRVKLARARAIEMRTAREEAVLCDTAEAIAVVEEIVGTMRAGFGGLAAQVTRDLALRASIGAAVDNQFERLAAVFARRATELKRPSGKAPPAEDAEPTDAEDPQDEAASSNTSDDREERE